MKKLMTVCFVAVFVLAASSVAQSATLEVRPPGGTGALGDVYTSIQQAIDDASPGDTISVADGTYEEDLTINVQNLTLESKNGPLVTTIKGLASEPWGSWPLAVPNINILASGVTVTGFTIESPDMPDGNYSSGIVLDGTNVEIYDNNFVSIGAGDGGCVVIQTYRDNVLGYNSDISGLDIHNNSLEGTPGGGYVGVFINHTLTGAGTVSVQNNTLNGSIAQGIVSERDNTVISGNTITGSSGIGIIVQDWNVRAQDSVSVNGNTLTNLDTGILIGKPAQLMTNISVENNTIQSNGVGVKVRGTAAGVVVNYNEINGNTTYGVENTDATVLDATLNCWADQTGPYHPVINAGGAGDEVSDNVDVYPWYIDCTMTTPVDLPVHNVTQDIYYYTIQSAIDAANPADQIVVAAGTFVEQLEITIPLTITGAGEGSTIVQSPDNLTLFYTTSADNYPIVYLHDVAGVTIKELTVDGAGKGNDNYRFNGIAFFKAGGTIQNVTLINVMDTPFSGAQHGVAIYAFNEECPDRNINILNCTVQDFQKNAIALAGANAICHVEGCVVTGAGDTTVTAQNGIQFGYGSQGTIKSNTVSDIRYTGPNWSASGILGYGSGGSESINVQNNTVTNTQGALQIYLFNGDVNVADNNLAGNDFSFLYAFDNGSVTGNSFDNCTEGLYLADVTNITGSGNTFNDCNVGLVVDGASDGVSFTDCQFNNNSELGIAVVPYEADNPDNISIECSQIVGNADYGVENTSSNVVDARKNWWGYASGPSGVGPGSGDSVSTNVDYVPWLLSEDCNDYGEVLPDFVVDDNWVGYPDYNMVTVGGEIYYIGLNAFAVIQDAVDAAAVGNTIKVLDGTYEEAVTIDKANLTLKSLSTPIIKPSTTPANHGAAIYISADGVTVDGFEIDGTTVCDNGIYGWETSGLTIKNNVIHGAVHGWDGCGILLISWGNSGTVYDNLIQNNEVYNTGRMGIMVMEYGSTWTLTSDITIAGNTVYDTWQVGWGDDGGSIQINVPKDCSISDNLVFDSNDRGIYMFGSASGNKIVGNTITNNPMGIQIWISGEGGSSIDWQGETPTSPMVISNNIYDNNTGAISTNIAGPNMVMDAEYNWWGDATGPKDPCGTTETDGTTCPGVSDIRNDDGLGDGVSENVSYCAWLTTPVCTSTNPCPAGDLNFDGCVNWLDVAILAERWLEGCEE